MDMLASMDISHVAGLLGGSLSYGQRKLLELAAVMMARPQLVLLDEPAGGVNPGLIERIGEHIRELNRQGVTFLLVEHNMPFVMGMCQQVVALHRGTCWRAAHLPRFVAMRLYSTHTWGHRWT